MTVREYLETLNYCDFEVAVFSTFSEILSKYFTSSFVSIIFSDLEDWLSSTYDECTIL